MHMHIGKDQKSADGSVVFLRIALLLGSCNLVISEPLRFGILGAAKIAKHVLLNPTAKPTFHNISVVSAIASRREEVAAKFVQSSGRPEIRVLPTYDALLSDPAIDCVYVPLPTGLHYQWVVRALQAGKHVLVEKPIAANVAEASRMAEVARERGRVLVDGLHSFHHPYYASLRNIVTSGEIGVVQHLHIRLHMAKGTMDPKTNNRYDSGLAGGATMDMGGYTVGCLIVLMGGELPDVVQMNATRWDGDPQIDVAMTGRLFFRGAQVTADVSWSFIAKTNEQAVFIIGTKGSVRATRFHVPHARGAIFIAHGAGHHQQIFKGGGHKKVVPQKNELTTSYDFQLLAFSERVHRVQTGLLGAGVEVGPVSMLSLSGLLDHLYLRAGMQPRLGPSQISVARTDIRPVFRKPAAGYNGKALLQVSTSHRARPALAAVYHEAPCDRLSADGLGTGPSSLRVMRSGPQTPPLNRGFQFERAVHAEHLDALDRHGYFVLRGLVERTALRRATNALSDIGNVTMLPPITPGQFLQPNRLKKLVWRPLYKPKPWLKKLVTAVRSLQTVFFVALNIFAQRAFGVSRRHTFVSEMDYANQLEASADVRIYLNVALPGAVHQNPHWDVPNWNAHAGDAIVVDVPLRGVTPFGAPLEIWNGTHATHWHEALPVSYGRVSTSDSDHLQYKSCYLELNALARIWPSAAVISDAGDAIVRKPSTLHRGTSNLSPNERVMLTFFIRRRKESKGKGPKPAKKERGSPESGLDGSGKTRPPKRASFKTKIKIPN